MCKPTEEAMQAVVQVVKYLNPTQDEVLRLGGGKGEELVIVAYTASNWASDPNNVGHKVVDLAYMEWLGTECLAIQMCAKHSL